MSGETVTIVVECDHCGENYEKETDDVEFEEGLGHICDDCWAEMQGGQG